MDRIDDDIRSYSILSHRPTDPQFDGKFRELRVEVTRPGVKVRARSGYYATASTDILLTPAQRTLFANARDEKSSSGLRILTASNVFFPPGRPPTAVFTVDVSADNLKFKENGPAFEDSIQIMGLVSTPTGQSVTTFGRTLPVRLDKAGLEASRGGFISHSESVGLYPGQYRMEVLVNEPSTGKCGYDRMEISMQPPAEFALSDLILSHQIAKAAPEVKSDPLVVLDALIVPSASRQFRNGDRLILYFDIYNPKRGNEPNSDVEVALSITGNGRPLVIKLPVYRIVEPIPERAGRVQVAKYLELAGLPAGNYSLTAKATDRNSGSSASSESTFTLVAP